ncbi:MAG: hypothetical protein DME35_07720 [Verrucomicrobia bacterium]|nr:MAG: hypothetical protein DME35_07720 [Verrucomicrobiota bacterium]
MKHFLLASLFPALLTAQTMQLTEQLGKTVLYSDVALSPDGKNVAWVQSTAATTSKQTYVREASENSPATMINLAMIGDRTDADPAWSPDSKTLAFFSTAGEKDQKQLWTVNSDGLTPKKLTKLSRYAATISGSQFSTLRPASSGKFRRPICTFTISIGRPTTKCLSQRRPRGRATTIGGSRRSTRSTSPRASPHPSTNLPSRSRFRAGRRTGNRSRSLKG